MQNNRWQFVKFDLSYIKYFENDKEEESSDADGVWQILPYNL